MAKSKPVEFHDFEWSRIANDDGYRWPCASCHGQVRGKRVWHCYELGEYACNKQCAEDASQAEERVRNGGVRSMDDVVVDGRTLREHDHMHFDHMTRNYFGED